MGVNNRGFTLGQIFSDGFEQVFKNIGKVLLFGVMGIIGYVLGAVIIASSIENQNSILRIINPNDYGTFFKYASINYGVFFLGFLVIIIAQLMIHCNISKLLYNSFIGEDTSFKEIFPYSMKKIFKVILYNIMMSVILGLIVFAISFAFGIVMGILGAIFNFSEDVLAIIIAILILIMLIPLYMVQFLGISTIIMKDYGVFNTITEVLSLLKGKKLWRTTLRSIAITLVLIVFLFLSMLICMIPFIGPIITLILIYISSILIISFGNLIVYDELVPYEETYEENNYYDNYYGVPDNGGANNREYYNAKVGNSREDKEDYSNKDADYYKYVQDFDHSEDTKKNEEEDDLYKYVQDFDHKEDTIDLSKKDDESTINLNKDNRDDEY